MYVSTKIFLVWTYAFSLFAYLKSVGSWKTTFCQNNGCFQ